MQFDPKEHNIPGVLVTAKSGAIAYTFRIYDSTATEVFAVETDVHETFWFRKNRENQWEGLSCISGEWEPLQPTSGIPMPPTWRVRTLDITTARALGLPKGFLAIGPGTRFTFRSGTPPKHCDYSFLVYRVEHHPENGSLIEVRAMETELNRALRWRLHKDGWRVSSWDEGEEAWSDEPITVYSGPKTWAFGEAK